MGLLKFRKLHFSKSVSSAIYSGSWQNDHWFSLKLQHNSYIWLAGFLLFVLVFVSRDLELGGVPADSPSTKSYSDFSEISYVDKARWVMHDGMLYDPIQGQGQGHKCLKATQEKSTVSPAWD